MPDPVWLDTNFVIQVANGDVALEVELKSRAAAGQELLIVPASRQEMLYGNPLTMKGDMPVTAQQPSDADRAHIQQVMARLKIETDLAGANISGNRALDMARRVGLDMQDQVKRPKNLATPPSRDQISDSDSLVLSQVKAGAIARGIREPEMLTCETRNKGIISQAPHYGVKVVQVQPLPPRVRAAILPGPPPKIVGGGSSRGGSGGPATPAGGAAARRIPRQGAARAERRPTKAWLITAPSTKADHRPREKPSVALCNWASKAPT